jgi:ATP-dependent DNA helicase RecQ
MSRPRTPLEEERWQHARQVVLQRDDYRCTQCKEQVAPPQTLHVHHLILRDLGGTDNPNNLVTLCDGCHSKKHISLHASLGRHWLRRTALNLSNYLQPYREHLNGTGVQVGLRLLGKENFLPGQAEVVLTALRGQSVLYVSPTGSGKSLCYQLPAILSPNYSLVLSPLIALMNDQVAHLIEQDIPVTNNSSNVTQSERETRYALLEENALKLYFVTPERFGSKARPEERDKHATFRPDYLVVDEAHLISHWGYGFRPDYRRIGHIRKLLGNPPVIALTATATPETQRRIQNVLGIPDMRVIVREPDRPNISIITHHINLYLDQHLHIILNTISNTDGKVIIFTAKIEDARKLRHQLLAIHPDLSDHIGIYHSEESLIEREQTEARFAGRNQPELDVIIATSAFGMGVDIPNVHAVIHYRFPGSLDDYVQGIGRAGRDGKPSVAILLYADEDRDFQSWLRNLNLKKAELTDQEHRTEEKRITSDVQKMDSFARTKNICLQRLIRMHFPVPQSKKALAHQILEFLMTKKTRAKATSVPCCSNCHPEIRNTYI